VPEAKPFSISKQLVLEAWKAVKANKGSEGVDAQSIEAFEKDLKGNLYKVWNRMSSGSYFPPPVKLVEIPKDDGKTRKLGVPTVGDRVAQMIAKRMLEPLVEPCFHEDSYGYRPGKAVWDAVGTARERCMRKDWVIDLDIKGFFDNLRHELVMKLVKWHTDPRPELEWIPLYVERWLKAPLQQKDGSMNARELGTPQGGVISPLLANIFLHHVFDAWMVRKFKTVPFERYADDVVIHCVSLAQAKYVLKRVRERMNEAGLELHPDKTRIVYCKDDRRKGDYEHQSFTFLGYTFRPRSAARKDGKGKVFVGFLPAISDKAKKKIREEIRDLELTKRFNNKSLEDVAKAINPLVRGWKNHYGRFYPSEFLESLEYIDLVLARWVKRKYRKFHRKWRAAHKWLGRIARRQRDLFYHWRLGIYPAGG